MTITKNHEGALVVSGMAHGYLVTRTYFGYTRKEALALFKREFILN